jgi:hypothetical protein
MPTPTYTPLANITLGSTATSVTFSSINQTYRDLILVTNVTHSANAEIDLTIRFNGDSGANYSRVAMTGDGSTAASFAQTGNNGVNVLGASTTISAAITQVMDYSATDKHKTVLFRGNLTSGRVSAFAARWANTAAITSLSVSVLSGNYAIGSSFALYGIVA